MVDYDYIVIGLGCVGLSSLMELSKENQVLGLDMNGSPNEKGSSHGYSRIFRCSYYEGVEYMPMLKESIASWKEIEKETDKNILNNSGFISITDEENKEIHDKHIESSEVGGYDYEVMNSNKFSKDSDLWELRENLNLFYQSKGGWMSSKNALEAMKRLAVGNNGVVENEKFECFKVDGDEVIVRTNSNEYTCRKIIFCAGPWMKKMFTFLEDKLKLMKHTYSVYKVSKNLENMPSWISYIDGNHTYGLNNGDGRIKIGTLGKDPEVDNMKDFSYEHSEKLVKRNNTFLKDNLEVDYSEVSHMCCPITYSPDDDYVIDYHPETKNVIIACGFSGHGFKLSNVCGKIIKDLANETSNKYQTKLFSFSRF